MKWFLGSLAALVLLLGGFLVFGSTPRPVSTEGLISANGIHWHPTLEIYVKGVKQQIPAAIGLGVAHQPVHTHEDDIGKGVIHLEFAGTVRNEDVQLGRFFQMWGKNMRSFGANIQMTVNGEENTDYESYVMRDKDRIELRYD